MGSNLEKCGKFWKNGRFSGRIRPDWGNTARADMAGLGSIGLNFGGRTIKFLIEFYPLGNITLSHYVHFHK